jgi:hypothetical protein
VSNSPQTYTAHAERDGRDLGSSVPGAVANVNTTARQPSDKRRHLCGDGRLRADRHDNYNSLPALSAGNFVIDKATPTATLAGEQLAADVYGSPQSATVAISASSVPVPVANVNTTARQPSRQTPPPMR